MQRGQTDSELGGNAILAQAGQYSRHPIIIADGSELK